MLVAEQLNIFNKKDNIKNDIKQVDIFNVDYKIKIIEETEKDNSGLLLYKGELLKNVIQNE